MKQRNPYYKTLAHLKHKVIPSKKIYSRKIKNIENGGRASRSIEW